MTVIHSVGPLVITECVDNDGAPFLRATLTSHRASMDTHDVARLADALLVWARERAIGLGCTAGGDCPRHPREGGVHDPAFAEGRVSS